MLQEWKHFKGDVVRGYIGIEKVKSESFSEFWSFVSRHYRVRYPWLVMLLLIVRLLPIGSADCERMFSLMNRLKTDLRNSLTTKKLDVLTGSRSARPVAARHILSSHQVLYCASSGIRRLVKIYHTLGVAPGMQASTLGGHGEVSR